MPTILALQNPLDWILYLKDTKTFATHFQLMQWSVKAEFTRSEAIVLEPFARYRYLVSTCGLLRSEKSYLGALKHLRTLLFPSSFKAGRIWENQHGRQALHLNYKAALSHPMAPSLWTPFLKKWLQIVHREPILLLHLVFLFSITWQRLRGAFVFGPEPEDAPGQLRCLFPAVVLRTRLLTSSTQTISQTRYRNRYPKEHIAQGVQWTDTIPHIPFFWREKSIEYCET